MSGFSVISKAGTRPEPSFLIFCCAALTGRQSATAAVAMNRSCAGATAITAACICTALCTSMRVTPAGVGRCTGPATSVTSAPASAAARAMANPILPLDRLVMPRTGSSASKVGPAVTSTCRPCSTLGWKKAMTASRSSSGSSIRPSPVSPQACAPCPGPSSTAPSATTWATLRCVAGCDHISRFIAGATSNAQRSRGRARHSSANSSEARPCANCAMKSALAGATMSASAWRERSMWAMLAGARESHWSVTTGRPVRACMVTGVMKRQAASVITTCTVAPALTSSRASSADL